MYINLWNPVMIREQVDFSIVYCLEFCSRIFHFHWVNIQMRVYVQQRIHTDWWINMYGKKTKTHYYPSLQHCWRTHSNSLKCILGIYRSICEKLFVVSQLYVFNFSQSVTKNRIKKWNCTMDGPIRYEYGLYTYMIELPSLSQHIGSAWIGDVSGNKIIVS